MHEVEKISSKAKYGMISEHIKKASAAIICHSLPIQGIEFGYSVSFTDFHTRSCGDICQGLGAGQVQKDITNRASNQIGRSNVHKQHGALIS